MTIGLDARNGDVVEVASTTVVAQFDRATCALSRLRSVPGGWEIVAPDSGGLGFAIRLPLAGRRNNVALSEDQDPPTWDVDSSTGAATATWGSLRSAHGGVHHVAVSITVRAQDERLVFAMSIANDSELEIEDVVFPRLEGVRPAEADGQLRTFAYRYAGARRTQLWPRFENGPGYFGTDHPTYLSDAEGTSYGAPTAPFILLEGQGHGLYVGVDEPSSELVAWHAELHPGYGDSLLQSVPPVGSREMPEPVGIRFGVAHVPFVAPGETRALTPVALATYQGDWHQGADLYIARRTSWMPTATAPHWASEPHAWLQLHVNSPEDELRLQFEDLPEVARSCVRHGVSVIQLVGWNTGGQDRNNPSHDADVRLGGPDALAGAIAACQALGVRVVLFAKHTWADRSTQRFRSELVRDAVKDPFGDHYVYPGYRYQTMTQLLDINTRRLVPMCFGSERYLRLADEAHRGLLDLGADGMLFDESQHHTPALLCFDTAHGHRRGFPVYSRDRELIARFRRVGAGRDANFLYAGEACYDWEFEQYGLSYHRSEDPLHVPLSRYLQPDAQLMTAVTGFDDRNMINQALMYRYVLSYEPYNFKGRLEDFPATTGYGRAMDEMRLALRDWIWDAEFRDTVGAAVTAGNGTDHHPYAVFRRRDGDGVAVVIANYDPAETASVAVAVDDGSADRVYRLVDDAQWRPVSDRVVVPPRSAAVVLPARARSGQPGPRA